MSLVTDTRASSDWAQDGKGGIGTSPSMNTSRSRPSPWISTGNDAPWNPVDRSDLRNRWTDDEWEFDGRRTNAPLRTTWRALATPPSRYSSTRPVSQGMPWADRSRARCGSGAPRDWGVPKGRRAGNATDGGLLSTRPRHHPAYAAVTVTGVTTTTHRRRRGWPDAATMPRFRPRRRVAGGPSREPHRLRSRHTRPPPSGR